MVNSNTPGGNQADYLARRLARDRPDTSPDGLKRDDRRGACISPPGAISTRGDEAAASWGDAEAVSSPEDGPWGRRDS
jgi:hypothetical protein